MNKWNVFGTRLIARSLSIWLAFIYLSSCGVKINRIESSSGGAESSALTATDIGDLASTIRTFVAPTGYAYNSVTVDLGSDFISGNVCTGKTIFGKSGSATCGGGATLLSQLTASNALRDAGVSIVSALPPQSTSSQLTTFAELSTYTGQNLPTTGGYNYRDIPDLTKDDEGYDGTTCKYAPRPVSDCGISQATIEERIADCATSWNGATQCSRGQGTWKLVTRSGANKEVWQDQRTGLLWSSLVGMAIKWCRASGNIQESPVVFSQSYKGAVGTAIEGNGKISGLSGGTSSAGETITITFTGPTTFNVTGSAGGSGCQGGSITAGGLTGSSGSTVTWSRTNYCSFTLTQGSVPFANTDVITLQSVNAATYSCSPGAASGLQLNPPVSYCAEAVGLDTPGGENWGGGVYLAAKGLMGKNSIPAVRWRSPTIEDFKQADVNGIRMVMPDMGTSGMNRPSPDLSPGGGIEWSSSLVSNYRNNAWYFQGQTGSVAYMARSAVISAARCVGR